MMTGRTFTDAQGFNHTVFITQNGVAELVPGNPFTLVNHPWPAGYPTFPDSALFSAVVFNGQLFFDNGIIPLSYFIGDGNIYAAGPGNLIAPNVVAKGDFPGAAFFLGAFASRLLALNTVEPFPGLPGSTNFPRTIRYSAVNNALEWDFTVDASAGEFIISDAEDALTGWMVVNQTGFAFRKNGITAINVTANAQIPFFVENFSIGPDGVGCYIPYTLSGYGTVACFIAQDDVYMFNGGIPQAIGGNAKRSIFRDLASASSSVFGRMVGSFGNFVDYLTYWIAIPQQNDTLDSLWIYHFDDQSWVNVQLPYGAMRCVANVATA
jgi:hypothetical protein